MARLKYNAQLEQAIQDVEDDYTGEIQNPSHLRLTALAAHCIPLYTICCSVTALYYQQHMCSIGQPLSKWLVGHKMGKAVDPAETRAVFVVRFIVFICCVHLLCNSHIAHTACVLMCAAGVQDECACIGCKMCVWCASGTFRIDEQHGRSRVFAQWVDQEEKIEVSLFLVHSLYFHDVFGYNGLCLSKALYE